VRESTYEREKEEAGFTVLHDSSRREGEGGKEGNLVFYVLSAKGSKGGGI